MDLIFLLFHFLVAVKYGGQVKNINCTVSFEYICHEDSY